MMAGHRGHRLSSEDKLRARAIEMLMCDFRIDLRQLRQEFGADAVTALGRVHASVSQRFAGLVTTKAMELEIAPAGRPLARMIASEYDAYRDVGATFSKVS